MGVHQRVAAGLDLGDAVVVVEVERAGPAGADDVAADVGVGLHEQRHRRVDLVAALIAVGDHHQVALVAHHAAHLEAGSRAPGRPGAPAVAGRDAASRQPDVDVDQAPR